MSEDALRRADEIRTSGMVSSQSDDNGGRVGQGNASSNGRPAGKRRSLEVKEEKDAAKEAFNGGALASFLGCPGRWQAATILLSLGIPGDNGDRAQNGVDPVDEAQASRGRVHPDTTGADREEANGPLEQWSSKGRIMDIGRREEVKDGQA